VREKQKKTKEKAHNIGTDQTNRSRAKKENEQIFGAKQA
jgi:hypothetical protein